MRPILSAEIVAVGSELTTGSTRDTNSGDLARELTALGVRVLSSTALPDDLTLVRAAFASALERADLIVSTGGLGPTPDDLTREAIAAACGLEPFVDAEQLAWLERLFKRRGLAMPAPNLKQAWLIEGASALPNPNGSAPGWWVKRPDGRLIVALPGPPREMRPMWREHALPRLQAGRLGVERASHTLRLSGIGESALVELIGEDVLRAANPQVATYARADAVDVVVSAHMDGAQSAATVVAEMLARLRQAIGEYIFAEGEQGWPDAIGQRLDGRNLAIVECGTAGHLAALLGSADFLVHAELRRDIGDLAALARATRADHAVDVGMAVYAAERGGHMRVEIALDMDGRAETFQRTAFLAGDEGRRRSALAASAALWRALAGPADD